MRMHPPRGPSAHQPASLRPVGSLPQWCCRAARGSRMLRDPRHESGPPPHRRTRASGFEWEARHKMSERCRSSHRVPTRPVGRGRRAAAAAAATIVGPRRRPPPPTPTMSPNTDNATTAVTAITQARPTPTRSRRTACGQDPGVIGTTDATKNAGVVGLAADASGSVYVGQPFDVDAGVYGYAAQTGLSAGGSRRRADRGVRLRRLRGLCRRHDRRVRERPAPGTPCTHMRHRDGARARHQRRAARHRDHKPGRHLRARPGHVSPIAAGRRRSPRASPARWSASGA